MALGVDKDAEGQPVRLEFKNEADVKTIGFEALPVGKMGLYQDARRTTWPVKHLVRQVNCRRSDFRCYNIFFEAPAPHGLPSYRQELRVSVAV
ncbi:MAG TPA: hypothetical protein DDZ88_00895 [Verrucomicrobiales bacterium]|nr:hypothetical protein [Verrucomicrobiales bacterium]